MSAPTLVAALWDLHKKVATLEWNQTVTLHGANGAIVFTDTNGAVWESAGPFLSTLDTGSTLIITIAMVASVQGADFTGTVNIVADTVRNGGAEGNATITEAGMVNKIGTTSPWTSEDVSSISSLLGVYSGTLSPASLTNDITTGQAGLVASLKLAPRAMVQANALLTAVDTFLKSSRDNFSVQTLKQSRDALVAAMPKDNTFPFGITAAGL